ncbi:MAG: hypothetical protein SH820_14365, partial [Xanthomonadales bacterium]|nr:hypothetical protein [Xanthomonadales bacterium]
MLMTLLLLIPSSLIAAVAEPGSDELEEVIVSATRIPTDWLKLPLAASQIGAQEIHAGRQGLGLDEMLASVPGLFF